MQVLRSSDVQIGLMSVLHSVGRSDCDLHEAYDDSHKVQINIWVSNHLTLKYNSTKPVFLLKMSKMFPGFCINYKFRLNSALGCSFGVLYGSNHYIFMSIEYGCQNSNLEEHSREVLQCMKLPRAISTTAE